MRRIAWIFALLLLAGLLAAGWYAYDKGFTKKWRGFVMDEFRKRGVEISMRRLTLEPWRGIVAKEVKFYDARDRRRVLAVIDEMRLVVNYANLAQGKPFLDALDLRDAHLALPLDTSNPRGPKFEARKLSARLLLPPRQIYLSRFEAEIYGIRVTASGRLIRPEALARKGRSADSAPAMAVLARVISELKALAFEAEPPQLDVRFSGDLAQPEELFAEATLWGEKIRRKAYRLENLYLTAVYRDGVLAVRQLVASDARGVLRASGSYAPATREAALRLDSRLDAQGLAKALQLAPALNDFVFYEPPSLELSASASFGEKPALRLVGHFALERFAYRSVVFESAAADFSWDGGRWSARDVRLVHRTGKLAGDVMQLPGDFRSRFSNTIEAATLAPVLTGKVGEWFSRLEFTDAPVLNLETGITDRH